VGSVVYVVTYHKYVGTPTFSGTMSSKERRTQTARFVPLRVGRRTSLKAGHYKYEGASAKDGKNAIRVNGDPRRLFFGGGL
jgi:hypothetical protein